MHRKTFHPRRPATDLCQALEARRFLSASVQFNALIDYVGQGPVSVAAGDFKGDGFTDLVTANYDAVPSSLSLLISNGDGTFAAPTSIAVDTEPTKVISADINHDGMPDLIVLTASGIDDVLLNQGGGAFGAPLTFDGGFNAVDVAVADMNSDGVPDLLVLNNHTISNESSTISILLGNGDGTFQPAQTYACGTGLTTDMAVADLNGDGIPDVAVANTFAGTLSVLTGNGAGGLNPPVAFSIGYSPMAVAIGDFNGDGKPDLSVAFSGTLYTNVAILAQGGNFQFGPLQTFSLGTTLTTTSLAAADFNGDGRPDLAVTSYANSAGSALVLLNNGDGTLASPQSFAIDGQPVSLIATPLSQNALPSIVGVSQGSNLINVLVNTTPPGSFATLTNGLLTFTGTAGNDSIRVYETNGQLFAKLNGVITPPIDPTAVTSIVINALAGNDRIRIAASAPSCLADGGSGNDTLSANNTGDTLNGQAGADSLRSSNGQNLLQGGKGADTLVGGSGADTLVGGAGRDMLATSNSVSLLLGGPGADTLFGPDGGLLIGGAGLNETLPIDQWNLP